MIYVLNKKVSSFFICAILVLAFFCVFSNIYAKRYDKDNFPVSTIKDNFPASYQKYIDELKKSHPNWIFKAVYTGLDWNEVITHESYEVNDSISLVPDSYGAEWKKDGQNYYKDGYFVVASKEAVMYMIDPRNHLTENDIFQFETLNYSQSAHTKDAVEKVLYGTSMYQRNEYKNAGNMVKMDKTYSQIILEKAIKYNVSATHVASRIRQETGCDIINNESINGSVSGYEGLYNFFNIGATANSNGSGAILNGLQYARSKSWTTPELSIDGGVDSLQNKWIKWGQNTTYFQKWDVNNEGSAIALYAYQYMQNIIAPTSESAITKKAYERAGLLNETYEFRIPVFENMPEYAAPYPSNVVPTNPDYETDYTKVRVDSTNGLNLRNGPGTEYGIITTIKDKTEMIRVAKSINTQWDRVRLSNGVEGYVFRDGIIEIDSYVKVSNVALNKTDVSIKVGQSEKLVATISPSNASIKDLIWSISDGAVASISQDGVITAKKAGSANVTVTTKDGAKTAVCKVTVQNVRVESITLNSKSKTLKRGETFKLIATVLPENAFNKSVEYKSSNENIAVVDKNGVVTPKANGEAIITVTSLDDKEKKATCKIIVDFSSDSITIPVSKCVIAVGDSYELIPTVFSSNNVKDFDVEISNGDIIEYKNNKIVGKKKGTSKITFITKDKKASVSCDVTVIIKDENKIEIDSSLNYDKNTNYISKVNQATKVSDIKSKFESRFKLVIKDKNGNKLNDSDIIGTGSSINFVNDDGSVYCSYTILIYGDVNGDGYITSKDYMAIKNHIMETSILDKVYFKSADLKEDKVINSKDYMVVKNHIMEISLIKQK